MLPIFILHVKPRGKSGVCVCVKLRELQRIIWTEKNLVIALYPVFHSLLLFMPVLINVT